MHWITLIVGFFILIAMSAAFKETGVDMPSRSALRSIRRRARKAGKDEWQAVADNIERKQKRLRKQKS
jgi:hypothetical protein